MLFKSLSSNRGWFLPRLLIALGIFVQSHSGLCFEPQNASGNKDWLYEVEPLRRGAEQSFQFHFLRTTEHANLSGYVSWGPPDRRCAIVCDAIDGLPLMVAVDGLVWLYDPIGGQVVKIRAEPEVICKANKGILWMVYGFRADFPTYDSTNTFNIDPAPVLTAEVRRASGDAKFDVVGHSASFGNWDCEYQLKVTDDTPLRPTFFLWKTSNATESALVKLDSFKYGQPVPSWHRMMDESALKKHLSVVAVADKEKLAPDVQERLAKLQTLVTGQFVFYIRTLLRDEKARNGFENNGRVKLDFKELKANDERIRDPWRKALVEQGFNIPELITAGQPAPKKEP